MSLDIAKHPLGDRRTSGDERSRRRPYVTFQRGIQLQGGDRENDLYHPFQIWGPQFNWVELGLKLRFPETVFHEYLPQNRTLWKISIRRARKESPLHLSTGRGEISGSETLSRPGNQPSATSSETRKQVRTERNLRWNTQGRVWHAVYGLQMPANYRPCGSFHTPDNSSIWTQEGNVPSEWGFNAIAIWFNFQMR